MEADKEAERLRSVIAQNEKELANWQQIAELRAQERDEWKAHAERLRDVAEILLLIDHCEECREECGFNRDAVKRRLAETPQASLATLKAEAVERAANDLYDRFGLSREALDFLAARAEWYRSEARSQQ